MSKKSFFESRRMQNLFQDKYEMVVVGCGGMGSSVLFHASKNSSSVLGIEQFTTVHDRGSSHGKTRIIRQAYFEHPDYVPLLLEAYQEWHQLEKLLNRRLFFETGLLQVGPPNGPVVTGVLRSAAEHHLQVDHWTAKELEQRFPIFRIPSDHEGIYERKAGYLLVEDCVRAHLDGALLNGAQVAEQTQLLRLNAKPDHIELETTQGNLRANRVVLTVGPWLGTWLHHPNQPLRVLRKHLHWFETQDDRLSSSDQCPLFLFENETGCFYGFPNLHGEGIKVAEHSGGELVISPTNVNRELDRIDLARVEAFLSSHFASPFRHLSHSVCMYTMTRDHHFLVDQAPTDPRILIAGGFSGHGFKFASVIGRLVADWSLSNQRDPRLAFLTLQR